MVGLVIVALTVLWAGVLSYATARRPEGDIPDLEGFTDAWSSLHGDADPRSNPWVRGWLAVTYTAARPLARVGVLPHALTLWSVVLAVAVMAAADGGGRWPLVAALLVVLSGLADGLDGCVAVLTGRSSRWGYVVDSAVDRLADVLYLVALWFLFGSGPLAVTAGVLGWMGEYVRARAGSAGMTEIGVVTVGERATRIVVIAFTLAAAGLFPEQAPLVANVGLGALVLIGLAGLIQLLPVVRTGLREA